MLEKRIFDLSAIAKVLSANVMTDKNEFLTQVNTSFESALDALGIPTEERKWTLKLALQMIDFRVNNRLLDELRDNLKFQENSKDMSFIRRLFANRGHRQMAVSMQELAELAASVYRQNNWGSPLDLKRHLELVSVGMTA